MNIVLVGFMGTGKTAVARRLAERQGMEYLDLDDMIESREARPISQIFEEEGEDYFRKLEKDACRRVARLDNLALATGGGVVLDSDNMENLRRNGIIICLKAKPEVIYSRIKEETHRPLLNIADPMKKIKELLKKRAAHYAKADFSLDTSRLMVEEVVDEVLELSKRNRSR